MTFESRGSTQTSFIDMGSVLQDKFHQCWAAQLSGVDRYTIEDFQEIGEGNETVEDAVLPSFNPEVWFWSGYALFILLIVLVFFGLNALGVYYNEYHAFGLSLFVGVLAMFVPLRGLRRAKEIIKDVARGKFEVYQTLVPAWGFCRIGAGSQGISIDGTYFLYLVEWDEFQSVKKISYKEEEYLQCVVSAGAYKGYSADVPILKIPKRFFDAPSSNIGWDKFLQLPQIQKRMISD